MVVPGFIKTAIITMEMVNEFLRRVGRGNMEANTFYGYIRPWMRELTGFISEESYRMRLENYNRMMQFPADFWEMILNMWTMIRNYFNP